jgi:lipoprotein-anchoring transpeptidase ErfK/SrfK
MLRAEDQARRLAAITSAILMAAAEAMAQENPATSTRRIVVSIPDRKLALIESGRVVKIYPAAVGAPRTPSPAGSYRIVRRVANPTWYGKARIVPPGKSNPVGTRWLGLSIKGYGIHGTSNPASIGRNVSHGCIRMRNRDVEDLFERVAVGDEVDLYAGQTAELNAIFGEAEVARAAAGAAK